jgi:hypothetical protein
MHQRTLTILTTLTTLTATPGPAKGVVERPVGEICMVRFKENKLERVWVLVVSKKGLCWCVSECGRGAVNVHGDDENEG